MAVSATDAQNAANAAAGNSTALGRARLAENFDTFLSLLTAQLKNQDPLSPLDSNQFTQQLTQMTGVEQQLATNDLLKELVANTANGLSTAVSLIGKQVKAVSDNATLVNGKATWTYNLGPGPSDVKIDVLDEKGVVVFTKAVDKPKEGDTEFVWDGTDRVGNKIKSGTFTLRVTAKDSEGGTVPHTTYINGVVSAVEQVDGETLITVGGTKVGWTSVSTVAQPPAPPAQTAENDDDNNTNPPTEDEA